MGRALLVAGSVGLFAVACGDTTTTDAPVPTLAPADTAGLPATTLVRQPQPGVTVGSLVVAELTEPCPDSSSSAGSGADATSESGRLEPMLGQVLAYGSRHPDEFGSYGLVWHDGGDASVFVSFTGDLDAHRQALASEVQFPDELIVCQVALTGEARAALQAQLVEELEGRVLSIGQSVGGLQVTLAAGEAVLAADLHARYGPALDLFVGALAYPIDQATSVCGDPPATTEGAGLTIEIVPPSEPIDAAGTRPAGLTVRLTNTGESPIQFMSGTALGTLLDSDGRVVNAHVGALALMGINVALGPGDTTELPLAVTTASCDPALGYVVPPGEYRLVAAVQLSAGELTTIVSQSVAVSVGGRAPEPVEPAAELDGTWQVTSAEVNGQPVELIDAAPITLTIEGSALSGTAACNSYYTTAEIGSTEVDVGGVAVDEIGCEPAISSLQDLYLSSFGPAVSYVVTGTTLTWQTPTATWVFERVGPRPAAPLVGTVWVLTTVTNGFGAMSFAGMEASQIVFADDGSVSGSTGCRDFTGTWESDGALALVTEVELVGECTSPLAEADQIVADVLADGLHASVEGDRLAAHPPGDLGLEFTAQR